MPTPSLIQIFWSFFKIGSFTVGGGYAMLPLFQREVVGRKAWVDETEFVELLALAQSAPGPIAFNTAVFVGYKTRGVWGSLVGGLGISLPSFLIILGIVFFLSDFKDLPAVERVFKGIRPAVVALIVASLWSMGQRAGIGWRNAWLPVAVILLVAWLGVSPVYVILATLLIGGLSAAYTGRKQQFLKKS